MRTSPAGAETSLAPAPRDLAIYDKFIQRKQASAERLTGLKAAQTSNSGMNCAHGRAGRGRWWHCSTAWPAPTWEHSSGWWVVVRLYAYEAAAGVRLGRLPGHATSTLLWDTRKRIIFPPKLYCDIFLAGGKKRDPKFASGKALPSPPEQRRFEVDIIRRERTDDDPHPIFQRTPMKTSGWPRPLRQHAA